VSSRWPMATAARGRRRRRSLGFSQEVG
jgi:hypothetical protein